jgi:hypothetical protein
MNKMPTRFQSLWTAFGVRFLKTKKPCVGRPSKALRKFELASTYSPKATTLVPSALVGLTILFGMGRSGTPPPETPTILCLGVMKFLVLSDE